MRLIDADALKKCAIPCQIHNGALTDLCVPLYQIDNAPTVEPDMEFAKWVTEMIFGNNKVEDFDFELFSELACRKLEKLGLVKKTESEWITSKIDGEKYNCSECGGSCWYYDYQGNVSKSNFCPNCGADMRGE